MMLLMMLACFLACSDHPAEADGFPTEEIDPADDLGTIAEPIPEAAEEIPADPEPIPLEVLEAEAQPMEVEGVEVDPVLLDPEDVLLQQILAEAMRSLPGEWVVLAELVILTVRETISLLAENGRLNPGEGQFTSRQEKLGVLGLALFTLIGMVLARFKAKPPSRLPESQVEEVADRAAEKILASLPAPASPQPPAASAADLSRVLEELAALRAEQRRAQRPAARPAASVPAEVFAPVVASSRPPVGSDDHISHLEDLGRKFSA